MNRSTFAWMLTWLALAMLALQSGAHAADKIRFGMLRSPSQVYAGIEKKFFEKEGIDVEIVFFRSGAELVPSLSRGQIDIAATTPGAALFNALASGVATRIVADYLVHTPGSPTHAVMVRSDLADRVRSAKDMKGLTVAITARGQYTDYAAGKYLEQGGLSEKDVRVVNMAYPDMVAAFNGKAIDVAMMVEPFITNAVEQNLAKPLAWHSDYMPNLNFGVVMYGERLMKDHALGVRFMRAYMEAMNFTQEAMKNPALRKEFAAITQKYVPLPSLAMQEKVPLPAARRDPTVDRAKLAEQMQWYGRQGLIPKPPDIDAIVDDSFVKAAARR